MHRDELDWKHWTQCNGIPNPLVLQEINTYLFFERQVTYTNDVQNTYVNKCLEIFNIMDAINDIVDLPLDLNLVSGFYQIPLADPSREFTAFSTNHGYFYFKPMAVGMKTSPSTFQRLMSNVLAGIIDIKCLVYLDDIIVYGKNLIDHNNTLREVFERLRNNNLKIQLNKCEFLKREECVYLGYIRTKHVINPDPKKIAFYKTAYINN
ncbi:Cancer susceptibility candidate 1, N-terminal,Reverse transcriptase domain [Cinara cedri]|uniref:Cancer susceptibility candidate 1, N-terminal,Reverse transcriptase domain n=1 Tax=Cinara cedri TaxID=506608 RepID=A0A5E4MZ20_9HEMI|nr:Cancer susceptibility candidate 1, N-terminal,Reverse transcriptase domain [Cinara cedri]